MSAGVRIIMFGRQGAGKGTQSARLAKYFEVPHISTGEMLRNAVKQDSVVGRSARAVLDRGELVDDDLMVSLVQGRIGQEDARTAGFVLDGFPRTIGQATAFDALTQTRPIGFVIDLDVAREIVVGRLSSRRTCERCDAIYTATGNESSPWNCQQCGGAVVQRTDDSSAAINKRLDVYETLTAPLISYYQGRGSLHVVDGLGSPDQVFDRIKTVVETGLRR
ncbi:MAG: adenylate kinase [Ilumatobacteraceae bacterium]|jgi:adenylate kinase|nr:MAG: adenylate kinase [Acidimicrobium sp. BACL27 MAG-120823-bin4]MDA2964843.1 adenylate kinase [Actinomycetota bacterium]MDP5088333.1 adenylate kinase [Ilumatobacteraceae bacterium]